LSFQFFVAAQPTQAAQLTQSAELLNAEQIDQFLKDKRLGWYLVFSFHGQYIPARPYSSPPVSFSGKTYFDCFTGAFCSFPADLNYPPYLISKISGTSPYCNNSDSSCRYWNQYNTYTFGFQKDGKEEIFSISTVNLSYYTTTGVIFESNSPLTFRQMLEYLASNYFWLFDDYQFIRKSCGVGCIPQKLSSKFPFDIFAGLSSQEITCPRITVSFPGVSRDFDLCWIYQAMRPIKYAIAISLLVKIYLYS
jgi:hypothetical protein